jgi:GH24 family phage-related lysozyme (muramidase)
MALSETFDMAKKAAPAVQDSTIHLYGWMNYLNQYNASLETTKIEVPALDDLKLPESWGPAERTDPQTGEITRERPPSSRVEPRPNADHEPAPVDEETWNEFLDHLLDREGYRNTVYADSLGKPTVGVGHLVLPEDNLKIGDTISDEQVREFLEADASKAYQAAIEQANELGINDAEFVKALGSVNYQLGTGWRNEWNNTWAHMKTGNYEQAISNIEGSLWAKQTPVRTADFVKAIERVQSQGIDGQEPIKVAFDQSATGKPDAPAPKPEDQPAPAEQPAAKNDAGMTAGV